MIGNPRWFTRRKYTGWGFTPSTWQGYVYVLLVILPAVLLASFPPISHARMIAIIVWVVIICFDFIHIMLHLKKDERDTLHEAIAERNALWIMLLVLIIGVGYQTASSVVDKTLHVDPVIIIAIVAATIVKTVTNIYLDKKD